MVRTPTAQSNSPPALLLTIMFSRIHQVIFTSIPIVFSPLMLLEWKQGMKWRRARAEKVRVKKEKELEAEAVTRKELEGKS